MIRLLLFLAALPAMAGDWTHWVNLDSFAAQEDGEMLGLGRTTLLQRVRLNLEGDLGGGFLLTGAYELDGLWRERIGTAGEALELTGGPYLRHDDLNTIAGEEEDLLLLQNLDRLAITHAHGRGVLTIGRQAVGHGNGRFFNPSDLFAPLSATTLNAQYKAGIDGVHYNRGWGEDNAWSLMAFYPEEGDGIFLARLGMYVGNLDLSVLAGETYGEPTLAWDLAGTWRGASLTTEGVWRKGEDRDDPLRLAVGINRRFGLTWDLTLEAQYNSLGTEDPLDLLTAPELRAGELVWLAELLVAGSASVELTPLIRLTSSLIWENRDDSAYLQTGLSWDATSRATVNAGLLATRGDPTTELGRFNETAYVEYRLTLP